MHNLDRKGFTFAELLVAMTLMGIVSVSIYSLLRNNQRIYREQAARIDLNQNVRAAVNILPSELRELDATDPAGSDIVAMTSSSITYNAMRNSYFLCQAPNTGALQITVAASPWYGVQALDIDDHLLLVFAENDPQTRLDDAWLRVSATARTADANACDVGQAGITLTLSGVTATELGGVSNGSPLRGYKVTQVSSYQDANGDYWIGSRLQSKADNSWSAYQPIVGPITSDGLQLAYYDANGAVTAATNAVTRIAVTVTGRTQEKVRVGSGLNYATQNQVSQIALRNNRRW